MKNIILKIIYHCKNDWFFRLWMSFYLNLLCMEGKMMMMLSKNILYQSKIDLQSWWWCCGFTCFLSRAKPVRFFLVSKILCIFYSHYNLRMLFPRHLHSDLLKQSRAVISESMRTRAHESFVNLRII